MKKKIAIIGSTGSIGETTLKIIDKDKKDYKIELLTTNKNFKKIFTQVKKFKVKNLIIHDTETFIKKKHFLETKKINVYPSLIEFKKKYRSKLDYTMCSISGLDGLESTLEIISLSKRIAIANKESIICGWNLIKKKLRKYKNEFSPFD